MARSYRNVPIDPKFKDYVPAKGTGYIYKISRKLKNGCTKGYIGLSTKPFKSRIGCHLCVRSGCLAIKAALKKYGRDAFDYEIIEENVPLSDLRKREQELIALHNTYHRGYNLTIGGETNPMESSKVRAKHAATMSSKEFIERTAVKRNKTFETREYKERTSLMRKKMWKTIDRDAHSQSIQSSWKRTRDSRVGEMKARWTEELKAVQKEGMRVHFEMKKDPNVTKDEMAEFKRQKINDASRRYREKKKLERLTLEC